MAAQTVPFQARQDLRVNKLLNENDCGSILRERDEIESGNLLPNKA